jgi:ferredoxin-NADP reductase
LLQEVVGDKLRHYATVTREEFEYRGRITDLISSGKLFTDLGVPPLDPEIDRGMICGSSAMLKDTKELLENAGLKKAPTASRRSSSSSALSSADSRRNRQRDGSGNGAVFICG